MAIAEFTTTGQMMIESCCNCNVKFAMTKEMYESRLEDGNLFYCPNGHSQHYTKRQDIEKEMQSIKQSMQSSIEFWRDRAKGEKKEVIKYKKNLTRIKNRVKNGVCPCCNRSFENLHDHIKTKHPKFK